MESAGEAASPPPRAVVLSGDTQAQAHPPANRRCGRSRHSWWGPGGEGLSHFGANRKDATGFGFNNQNGKKITKKVVQYFSCKGYYST